MKEALLDVGTEAGVLDGGRVDGDEGGDSFALKPSQVRKIQREAMGLAPEMPSGGQYASARRVKVTANDNFVMPRSHRHE